MHRRIDDDYGQVAREMSPTRPIPGHVLVRSSTPSRMFSQHSSCENISFSELRPSFGLMQTKDDAISMEERIYVSEKITTKWQRLLRQLFAYGDGEHDVDNIIAELEEERDHKSLTIRDVSMRALQEWIQRKGSDARFADLLVALQKVDRKDMRQELERKRHQKRNVFFICM